MVIKEINGMFSPDYVKEMFVPSQAFLATLIRQVCPVISSDLLAKMGHKELVYLFVASEKALCS